MLKSLRIILCFTVIISFSSELKAQKVVKTFHQISFTNDEITFRIDLRNKWLVINCATNIFNRYLSK